MKKPTTKQFNTLKKVLTYIRRYWFLLVLSLIFAAVTALLTLYVPILIGQAVDLILGKGQVDFAGILVILKKIAIIVMITAASQWLMNLCNNTITYNTVRDIRKTAFDKIQILPLKYIDGHSYGDVVSRVIADVDQFADGLLMGFTQLFTGVIHSGHLRIYVVHQCVHHFCGGTADPHLPLRGQLHCQAHLLHV